MTPLVSIIIPVFNRFEYADRAILSVLNQKYTNWELFVVDDCSNQKYGLPKICEHVQQKIKLLRNESNSGPGLSRQRGLDLAAGKFVCFLDSDDYWLPDFIMRSFETHKERNFSVGATYCQSKMTDGSLRRRNKIVEAVDDIFYGVVSGVRPWATCSLMWNTKYIATWSKLRTNQDAMFELHSSIINSRIAFIPEILVVINKDTGMNSEDLVSKQQIESNRNKVLRFATKLIYAYKGKNTNKVKKSLWISLKISLKKQLKYRNYQNFAITLGFLIKNVQWTLIRSKSN